MSYFDTVLTEIFDRGAEARLSQEDETVAIAGAQRGEEEPTVALLYAYAPALRNAASRHADLLGHDEARSAVVAGFWEAIFAFDPEQGQRLAGTLSGYLGDTLAEEQATRHAVTVPARTLKRFFGVLRRADGDLSRAAEIAPDYSLSREALHAIAEAIRWSSLDAAADTGEEGEASREVLARSLWESFGLTDDDRVLVEAAFDAVDDLEEEVCRQAYGFTDYDPVPDAEIAHRLGYSRPKIQRVRTGALATMRAALAVDVD